jgi:hypothetical protein
LFHLVPFHPPGGFQGGIDEITQRLAQLRFRHDIGGIRIPINPDDFRDLVTLIYLSEAHNVDHQPLFLGCAKFNKALVQRLRVGVHSRWEFLES